MVCFVLAPTAAWKSVIKMRAVRDACGQIVFHRQAARGGGEGRTTWGFYECKLRARNRSVRNLNICVRILR